MRGRHLPKLIHSPRVSRCWDASLENLCVGLDPLVVTMWTPEYVSHAQTLPVWRVISQGATATALPRYAARKYPAMLVAVRGFS